MMKAYVLERQRFINLYCCKIKRGYAQIMVDLLSDEVSIREKIEILCATHEQYYINKTTLPTINCCICKKTILDSPSVDTLFNLFNIGGTTAVENYIKSLKFLNL